MLRNQPWFLANNPIECASFSAKFVARMKRIVPELRCAETT
jgi:hypothetical protein